MDDVVTMNFTRDELATLAYALNQDFYQSIPEIVALANIIEEAIWASNVEPND